MNRTPLEHDEQKALVQWLKWQHPGLLFSATPNGGHRHPATAARLKAEGVQPGVPDLTIYEPRGRYHGLFIEMKRRRGGQLSPEQKVWLAALEARDYRVAVCKGFEEAKATIEEYLR